MFMDMGAAAFWIFLAAVFISGGWFRSRREQMKHETIRRIVEHGGQIDEEQLKALLQPSTPDWSHSAWARAPEQGGGYRAFRIFGALVIFLAAGLATFAALMFTIGWGAEADLQPLFPIASGIAVFGCGLFYCSRFLPKPLPHNDARNDRT